MKTDYPELEGKEIKYFNNGTLSAAIVIGCSYHIGITIVSKTNKNIKLYCLNRKEHRSLNYRQCFHAVVKGIQKGKLNSNSTVKILFDNKCPGYGQANCAFSQ